MPEKTIPDDCWSVPEELGQTHLDRVLKGRFSARSWNEVRAWIRGGNVFVDEKRVTDATAPVAAGSKIEVSSRPSLRKKDPQKDAAREDKGGASLPSAAPLRSSLLVYADSQVVVAEKPAGISAVPFDSSERDTLDRRVQKQLAQGGGRARLLVVHRIDKETTGLVVFARTQHALLRLKSQFRFHTTERKYFALVHGQPRSETIASHLVRDRGDGLRGSTHFPGQGREATTHVRVVEQLRGCALVACTLETGRTHQIRIHLAEAGHPLLGERVYSKGFAGSLIEAPRVLLHAATLGFSHPSDGRPLRFDSALPRDFEESLSKLRQR